MSTGRRNAINHTRNLNIIEYEENPANIELPVTKLTYEDSEATAINNVNAVDNSNKTYNIAGQRIASTTPGSLYISNGKTFIKK